MARRDRRGGRTTPKGTRPTQHVRGRDGGGLPPFVADAQKCLRERSPFALLSMASALVEVTTPRLTDGWDAGRADRPTGTDLFGSFVQVEFDAMHALALAGATLHTDQVLARRVRAQVNPGAIRGAPAWLASMDDITITDTLCQDDRFGDGENIAVSWRWASGGEGSVIVYVDHNLGTVVKDAFAIPEGSSKLAGLYASLDPRVSTRAIDPADARARIAEAIEKHDHLVPPRETDTWPMCRPMVEWVIARLPDGGAGYVRPSWTSAERDALLDRFVASPHAKVGRLGKRTVRELAEPLVWFGCDYGSGDPLRWSPVVVEIVLSSWYARKVYGLPMATARRLPEVLAGFVRFAHEERSMPGEFTIETVDSIDMWRADYLELLDDDLLDDDEFDDDIVGFDGAVDFEAADGRSADAIDLDALAGGDPGAAVRIVERGSIAMAGGREAWDRLDAEPLRDRPFDWSTTPDDVRGPTGETLTTLDQWATDLFDAEVRTIARAVLAAVMADDAGVFNRSARTDAFAAAILGYLLNRLTGRMSAAERRTLGWAVTTQKQLAAAAGVSPSTLSARVRTVTNVADDADINWPSILHSSQRRELLSTREFIREFRADHP